VRSLQDYAKDRAASLAVALETAAR
jgi:hypothetical protein